MGRPNRLKDYVEVKDRIPLFYDTHPQGRIVTEVEHLEPPLIVMKATLFRDHEPDTVPLATGFAYEKEGEGHVNETSYIENCETSAIGRALANAGFAGPEGAPRPSREEMEKVQRMRENGQAVDRTTGEVGGPECPKCDGPVWDNRDKKASGEFNPKSPDFACRDKDGCGWVCWLDSTGEKLQGMLESAKESGHITEEQYEQNSESVDAAVEGGDIGQLRATTKWIRSLGSEEKEGAPA